MSFPLFDQLQKKIETHLPSTSLYDIKEFIVDECESLSSTEHEIIYVLIRFFQKNENYSSLFELPFGAKKLKKGIKIDLEQLPDKLLYMLYEFLQMKKETF